MAVFNIYKIFEKLRWQTRSYHRICCDTYKLQWELSNLLYYLEITKLVDNNIL